MMAALGLVWTCLLVLAPWVSAGPVPSSHCAADCRLTGTNKFQHLIGKTYSYSFGTRTVTSLMGTSTDKTVLAVDGNALLTFRGPCDVILELKDTVITDSEGKVPSKELEKRPLMLKWNDGKIESICPSSDDAVWVVNIKRAVLSMLQHTASSLDISVKNLVEDDIVGRCPTEYQVDRVSGKSIFLTKTKMTRQCSHRMTRHSSMPSVAYNTAAEIQSLPLLNSTSKCEQHISDGVMQSVECQEEHLFRPMSTENGGGARTVATSSLVLKATKAAAQINERGSSQRSSLFLESSSSFEPHNGGRDVSFVVKAVCEQMAGDSQMPVAHLFTELVHALRKASPAEVRGAYANLRATKSCAKIAKTERFFLDALPQAGSTGAIALMVDLLKGNRVSKRQATGWYLSLPTTKYATRESIKLLLSLVEEADASPSALLGISGLARRFCATQKDATCGSARVEIEALSKKLAKQLESSDQNRVLAALMAIGNLVHMSPTVLSTLNKLIVDSELPIVTRLAAIDAFRSSPCNEEAQDTLSTLLEDTQVDDEVRISAYRGLMLCPSLPMLARIEDLIDYELSSWNATEAAGYMASHWENALRNRNPGNENLRSMLMKAYPYPKFPAGNRKNSRNIASSHFCKKRNAGWDLQADVIFSSKSLIPRVAALNLTVDLFGNSFNLLEVAGRQENLERLIASRWSKESSENGGDLPKVAAVMRVLGSTVATVNYQGGSGLSGVYDGIDSIILKALKDLSEGSKKVNIDLARSLMFLDSAITYPTIAGMPIKLAVNGTTSMVMELESKMDLTAMMRNTNSDLRLKISPLAVTELSAAMTVDMTVVKAGFKMVTTIHSSADADLTAKYTKSSGLDVKLNLPKTKIAVVEMKSELLAVHQKDKGVEHNRKVAIENETTYEHGGCSERTSAFTGLRACASSKLSIPKPTDDCSSDKAPMFPMSGTGSVSFSIEKTEPTMTGYSLSVVSKTEGGRTLIVTFDTPGSTTSRKITLMGELSYQPNLMAKAEGKTPWGNVSVEGVLVNKDNVRSATVKVVRDHLSVKRVHMARVQLNITRQDEGAIYTPSLELQFPDQPLAVVLEGKLGMTPTNRKVALRPAGPWADLPFGVEIDVTKDWQQRGSRRFAIEKLELVSPLGKVGFMGQVQLLKTAYSASADFKYGTDLQHRVQFNANAKQLPKKSDNMHAYQTELTYKSSRYPVSNVDLQWNVEFGSSRLNNTLILVHGPESEKDMNRLTIKQNSLNRGKLIDNFALDTLESENHLMITYPKLAVDLQIDQSLHSDSKGVKGAIAVVRRKKSLLDGSLSLVFASNDRNNMYEVDMRLAAPGYSFELHDVGKRFNGTTFTISPVLTMVPGGRHQLTGRLEFLQYSDHMGFKVDADLRMEGVDHPIKFVNNVLIKGDLNSDFAVRADSRLEWAGKTQMTFDTNIDSSDDETSFEIKTTWDGRFEGKIASKFSEELSGEVNMDMKFLRFDRRVKLDSSFKSLYDNENTTFKFEVSWDADRDADKSVRFDLHLKVPDLSNIDLKADVSVLGQNYTFKALHKNNNHIKYDLGTYSENLEMKLELPSLKKISLELFLQHSREKETELNHKFIFNLILPSQKKFAIAMSNDLKFLVTSEPDLFESLTQLRIEAPFGAMEAHPVIEASLKLKQDYGKNDGRSSNLLVKYKRGPMTVDFSGHHEMEERGTTTEAVLEVPTSSWKKISASASLMSVNDGYSPNDELQSKMKLVIGKMEPFTKDFKMKLTGKSFDMSLSVDTPFRNWRRQGLTTSAHWHPRYGKYDGSVALTWSVPDQSDPKKISFDIDVDHSMGESLVVKIDTTTPFEDFESNSIRLDGRRIKMSRTVEGELAVTVAGEKHEIRAKIIHDGNAPEVDLQLIRPDAGPLRFFARVRTRGPSADIRFDWGDEYLSANLTSKPTFFKWNDLDLVLKIDSPALDLTKTELGVIFKVKEQRRRFEMTLKNESAVMGSVKSVIDLVESPTSHQAKGSVDISIPAINFNSHVKVNANHKRVKADRDEGDEYRLEIDSTGDFNTSANALVRLINRETSGSLKTCLARRRWQGKEACLEGSLGYKLSRAGHEVYILGKVDGETSGLRGKYHFDMIERKFKHSVEVISILEQEKIYGYKAYWNNEFGFDVFTPTRTSGISLLIGKGPREQSKYTLAFALDKKKGTHDKLTIVVTLEPHKLGNLAGTQAVVLIEHPALTRKLEYKLELHTRGNSQNRAHFKIDVDVADSKHKRWTLETFVRGKPHEGQLSVETELRSKGAGVSIELEVIGAFLNGVFSASSNLKFKNNGNVEKELMASLRSSGQSVALAVGSPEKKAEFQASWSLSSIAVHRSFQLIGSSQIFGVEPLGFSIDFSAAPHADVRVFLKASPEKYYRLRADLVDDATRFELELQHQTGDDLKLLAGAHMALNGSSLLQSRLFWDRQELGLLRAAMKQRRLAIAKEIRSTMSTLQSQLKPMISKWEIKGDLRKEDGAKIRAYLNKKEGELIQKIFYFYELISFDAVDLFNSIRNIIDTSVFSDMIDSMDKAVSHKADYLSDYVNQWVMSIDMLIRSTMDEGFNSATPGGKFRSLVAALSQRVSKLIQMYRVGYERSFTNTLTWLESMDILDRSTVSMIQQLRSDGGRQVLRQQLTHLIEENVIVPVEQRLKKLAEKYPETKRIACRLDGRLENLRTMLSQFAKPTRTPSVSNTTPSIPSTRRPLLKRLVGEIVVMDLEKGEIQHELPLSRPISSLRELRRQFSARMWSMKGLLGGRSNMFDESLADLFNRLGAAYSYFN